MTFTIVATNPHTGAVGLCQGTGALGVATRCAHVRAGVAAIGSQSHSDWRIGRRALDLAESGLKTSTILDALRATDEHFEFRQILIATADGRTAAHTGSRCGGYAGDRSGDGFVVAGNGLVGAQVLDDMAASYEGNAGGSTDDRDFADHLLQAVEAGVAAGGEAHGHISSTIIVAVPQTPRPLIDLRVDLVSTLPADGGDSVKELRRIFDEYAPLAAYYADYWLDSPETTATEWLRLGSPAAR